MKNTDRDTPKKKSKTLLNILVIFTLLFVFSCGKNGEHISYYDNGGIKEKSTYKDGKRNGEAIWYYETSIIELDFENINTATVTMREVKVKEKGTYKDGRRNGETIWYYETGKVSSKSTYKDGVLID